MGTGERSEVPSGNVLSREHKRVLKFFTQVPERQGKNFLHGTQDFHY